MKKHSTQVSVKQVHHIAQLAKIPVSKKEEQALKEAFNETLGVIENLEELDTSKTEPTHQVTGLTNVLREDVVIPERMLTQEQALAQAKQTHKGFFVVDKVLHNEE